MRNHIERSAGDGSSSFVVVNAANKEIPIEDKARRYLDLLVDLGFDLPFHRYCRTSAKKDGYKDEGVDSFIGRYAPEHSGMNYIVRNMALILDAEMVVRVTKDEIDEDVCSEERRDILMFHYRDAMGVLIDGLRRVYSERGCDSGKNDNFLHNTFFSADKKPLIEEAMKIRRVSFNDGGCLVGNNLKLEVSLRYGNLVGGLSSE